MGNELCDFERKPVKDYDGFERDFVKSHHQTLDKYIEDNGQYNYGIDVSRPRTEFEARMNEYGFCNYDVICCKYYWNDKIVYTYYSNNKEYVWHIESLFN